MDPCCVCEPCKDGSHFHFSYSSALSLALSHMHACTHIHTHTYSRTPPINSPCCPIPFCIGGWFRRRRQMKCCRMALSRSRSLHSCTGECVSNNWRKNRNDTAACCCVFDREIVCAFARARVCSCVSRHLLHLINRFYNELATRTHSCTEAGTNIPHPIPSTLIIPLSWQLFNT